MKWKKELPKKNDTRCGTAAISWLCFWEIQTLQGVSFSNWSTPVSSYKSTVWFVHVSCQHGVTKHYAATRIKMFTWQIRIHSCTSKKRDNFQNTIYEDEDSRNVLLFSLLGVHFVWISPKTNRSNNSKITKHKCKVTSQYSNGQN